MTIMKWLSNYENEYYIKLMGSTKIVVTSVITENGSYKILSAINTIIVII